MATVNSLFTAFSNEIVQFRSHTMAGNIGVIAVVGLWRHRFPALRSRDRLVERV